jgi:hypothetical protein
MVGKPDYQGVKGELPRQKVIIGSGKQIGHNQYQKETEGVDRYGDKEWPEAATGPHLQGRKQRRFARFGAGFPGAQKPGDDRQDEQRRHDFSLSRVEKCRG